MQQSPQITKPFAPGESYKTGSEDKRERMRLYVDWLLTPSDQRTHKTKRALADYLGVSTRTLGNYDREPFVQRELAERARAVARVEQLPSLLDSLYKIATGKAHEERKGKLVVTSASAAVAAARTLLEWYDKTSPLREQEINVSDMTDQELVNMALSILKKAASDE